MLTVQARKRRDFRPAGALLIGTALLGGTAAQAKIDLVTLPSRDKTQVTIYNSVDLTLVREQRELTFKEGSNEIQFSWANTFIDPTSLHIHIADDPVNFVVMDASYPANTENVIVWNIEAKKEGKAVAEIMYFTSGVSWTADYTVRANADETRVRIEPDFTIRNNSGDDFVNAQTRLVVGEVNLLERIRDLAMRFAQQRGVDEGRTRREMAKSVMEMDMPAPAMAARAGAMADNEYMDARQIAKEAVSEYQLYSIEGTETLENGWGKQLPDPRVDDVPVEMSYEYYPEKYGSQVVKFYKFRNITEHKLGANPLPAGSFYVYSDDGRGGLRFQGSTTNKYVPIGEDVELNLGSNGRVLFEQRTTSITRTEIEYDFDGNVKGYDVVEKMEFEIRNSHERAVPLKVNLNFGNADWELSDESAPSKRLDRQRVEWELTAPSLETMVVSFTRTNHTGSRDRNTPQPTGRR